MELVYKYNDLESRNRTDLLDEKGSLRYWGIYDFAYKYRTRIFDENDNEVAYVQKDVSVNEDVVIFYDAAGNETGRLTRKDGTLLLEPDGKVYEGDRKNGMIKDLLCIKEGSLSFDQEEDMLKSVTVLFALVEIDR